MNTVRAIGGLLLSVCIAVNAYALEAKETEQVPNEGTTQKLESENVTATARDRAKRWVDSSHRFATDRTMALTRWVDSFFGDMDGDAEIAESRLRLKITTDWDERLGTETRVSVGGKVNLPRLADRVDLVFRGDDPDELVPGDSLEVHVAPAEREVRRADTCAQDVHEDLIGPLERGREVGSRSVKLEPELVWKFPEGRRRRAAAGGGEQGRE